MRAEGEENYRLENVMFFVVCNLAKFLIIRGVGPKCTERLECEFAPRIPHVCSTRELVHFIMQVDANRMHISVQHLLPVELGPSRPEIKARGRIDFVD